jgi:hypothetical protein
MRTTIEYDDALMQEISARAQKEHTSMKEILNRTLARGLGHCAENPPVFICPTRDLGRARRDIDRALRLADEQEEEAIAAKLELNK